jgi:hypothetical protein
MFKSLDIQKDREVVGLDGKHIGTAIICRPPTRIILSKDDPKAGERSKRQMRLDRAGIMAVPAARSSTCVTTHRTATFQPDSPGSGFAQQSACIGTSRARTPARSYRIANRDIPLAMAAAVKGSSRSTPPYKPPSAR